MITQFYCNKNNSKEKDSQPDYRLSAKIGEEWVEIGAGWMKEGKKEKYISFSLSKPFKDKKGWKIVEEEEIKTDGEFI